MPNVYEDLPGNFSATLWNALAIGLHSLIALGEFNATLCLMRERLWTLDLRPSSKRVRDADIECSLREYCATICALVRACRRSHEYRKQVVLAARDGRLPAATARAVRARLDALGALSQLLARQAARTPPVRADTFEWAENSAQTQLSPVWSADTLESIRLEALELHERLTRDLEGGSDSDSDSEDSDAECISRASAPTRSPLRRLSTRSSSSSSSSKSSTSTSSSSQDLSTPGRRGDLPAVGAARLRQTRSAHNSAESASTSSNRGALKEEQVNAAPNGRQTGSARLRSRSSSQRVAPAPVATSAQLPVKLEH